MAQKSMLSHIAVILKQGQVGRGWEGVGEGGTGCPETCLQYMQVKATISRVPDQNGVSQLYNMLEIHHSIPEPSIYYREEHFQTVNRLLDINSSYKCDFS